MIIATITIAITLWSSIKTKRSEHVNQIVKNLDSNIFQ